MHSIPDFGIYALRIPKSIPVFGNAYEGNVESSKMPLCFDAGAHGVEAFEHTREHAKRKFAFIAVEILEHIVGDHIDIHLAPARKFLTLFRQ